jgi:hypothetical protein
LNVGDLKPAESDLDYFMQLAWNEPAMATTNQHTFLRTWLGEQFPTLNADAMASLMDTYYTLNFIRKPEHMGFNGYDDEVKRTDFNPLSWGDQNRTRLLAMDRMGREATRLSAQVPPTARDAFFELVGYPVQATVAQNRKFLEADRAYLNVAEHRDPAAAEEAAQAGYDQVQRLTTHYNTLAGGKWVGMMSADPRERHVFEMPPLPRAGDGMLPLPAEWSLGTVEEQASGEGFVEEHGTISMNAAHFTNSNADTADNSPASGLSSQWVTMPELGISRGGSVEFGAPGLLAETPSAAKLTAAAPSLEYDFTSADGPAATLTVWLLPTFPVDSQHALRFGVALDDGPPQVLDAGGVGEWQDDGRAPVWEGDVLRNGILMRVPLGALQAGKHRLRLLYLDPGVVFEHLVVTRPGAAPAYPVPPETRHASGEVTRSRSGS